MWCYKNWVTLWNHRFLLRSQNTILYTSATNRVTLPGDNSDKLQLLSYSMLVYLNGTQHFLTCKISTYSFYCNSQTTSTYLQHEQTKATTPTTLTKPSNCKPTWRQRKKDKRGKRGGTLSKSWTSVSPHTWGPTFEEKSPKIPLFKRITFINHTLFNGMRLPCSLTKLMSKISNQQTRHTSNSQITHHVNS